ncbi:DUF6155 family protein [Bacillus thermotolerans]|uniref:Uncharacterized protein n=1 Tax=Bacillus thermotolerans TaxID=1221996 RepID=A0A0F5HSJ9_BACTR|nr:DUF6155 family protein [Bacillus thermotolerans]KKB36281.1 hypothetical protein QY95_03145 [Bacillus thermotolerans]KKB44818.1 hypothetical protein QY96_01099 [Bacillus thermotolerans]
MTKLKLTELKKELKTLEQKELIQLISELYKLNKDVQQYLSNKFIGEAAVIDLYEKTKKQISDQFFPDRGYGKLRLNEAKNAISSFKKLSGDPHRTLDLMLFYVEAGTEFSSMYGDIDSKFYDSMLSMYDKVVTACDKDETAFSQLKERLYAVVERSSGIEWGYYHDELCEIYYSMGWALDDEDDE